MTTNGNPTAPVLVGYDPHTLDPSPVGFALAAARLTGSPLIVAAVSVVPAFDSLPPTYGEEAISDAAEHAFQDLATDLGAHPASIEYHKLIATSAARGLYKEAERVHARLVVVGSTSRSAIGRVLPGSTAERLVHGAPCAVAVVPHGWNANADVETVGVAFTDTEEGLAALRFAHGLSRQAGTRLRVLSVVAERLSMAREIEPIGRYGDGRTLLDVEGEYRVQLDATMRDAVGRLLGLTSDAEVDFDSFVGDPADVLIGVSGNLDLLVCGSRGYGPVRAVMLGGVSRRVFGSAHCPVIVLARGAEAQ